MLCLSLFPRLYPRPAPSTLCSLTSQAPVSWVVGGIGPNSCWGSPRRASHPSGTLPGNFATLTAGCEALLAALRRGPAGFCVHTTAGQSVTAADARALMPWQAPLISLGRTVAQAQALASP